MAIDNTREGDTGRLAMVRFDEEVVVLREESPVQARSPDREPGDPEALSGRPRGR